jgi:hypothetical protein
MRQNYRKVILVETLVKRLHDLPENIELLLESQLTESQADKINQALTDELCETGLNPDGEPNQRGVILEELIDWINAKATNET